MCALFSMTHSLTNCLVLLTLCVVTYKRISHIVSYDPLLLVGQIVSAWESSLILVEVCHNANVPVAIKQNSGYPHSSQTDTLEHKLYNIAAETAAKALDRVTAVTNLSLVKRFDNSNDQGEDHRRENHVQHTIDM